MNKPEDQTRDAAQAVVTIQRCWRCDGTLTTGHLCPDKRLELQEHPLLYQFVPSPLPMILKCPECGFPHIDNEYWTKRLHRTHLCASCRFEWRPANCYTIGVAVLPHKQAQEPHGG